VQLLTQAGMGKQQHTKEKIFPREEIYTLVFVKPPSPKRNFYGIFLRFSRFLLPRYWGTPLKGQVFQERDITLVLQKGFWSLEAKGPYFWGHLPQGRNLTFPISKFGGERIKH